MNTNTTDNPRIAIIDLGTNTFHLMIVEQDPEQVFKTIYKKRRFVKIGKTGVNHISRIAYHRSFYALDCFKSTIEKYGIAPQNVYPLATEGLRRADNSPAFIQEVKEELDLDIQCISGDQEATLIYYGVRQAVDLGMSPTLIMDIGGGSVEFVIANQTEVFWKKSFRIGAAVLRRTFHQTEPIDSDSIRTLKDFLGSHLGELFVQAKHHKVNRLVGASGSFTTIMHILLAEKNKIAPENTTANDIEIKYFAQLGQRLLPLNLEERKQIEGINPRRADMMVVAYLLIDFVLQNLPITSIQQSNYAIKEGTAYCALKKQKIGNLTW